MSVVHSVKSLVFTNKKPGHEVRVTFYIFALAVAMYTKPSNLIGTLLAYNTDNIGYL